MTKDDVDMYLNEEYDTSLDEIAKGGKHAVKIVSALVAALENGDESQAESEEA